MRDNAGYELRSRLFWSDEVTWKKLSPRVAAAIMLLPAWGAVRSEEAQSGPEAAAVRLDLPADWEAEYGKLVSQIRNRAWFERIASQSYRGEALIVAADRDPLDVVLRRAEALLADVKRLGPRRDLSADESELRRLRARAAGVPAEKVSPAAPPRARKLPRPKPLSSPRAGADLPELDLLDEGPAKPAAAPGSTGTGRKDLFLAVCAVRRRIALANPLLGFDRVLFAKRNPVNDHCANVYYGMWARPGGGVFVLADPFGPAPTVRDVLAGCRVGSGRLKGHELTAGAFGWPRLSYDGGQIVFAYTQALNSRPLEFQTTSSFHLFRVSADLDRPRQIVQLTDGRWDDAAPCWLPNGRIAFMSCRRGGAARCGGPQNIHTLHSVNPDGTDLVCLSFHETHEWSPSVNHDGMIVYSRWDYVDRGDCIAHHPWICYPDGRDPRAIHGNYPASRGSRPDVEAHVRAIPGSTKYVATATGHHAPGLCGSLIVLDVGVEDDGAMSQARRLTPDVPFPEVERGSGDFSTPWPLSEDYYLCAYRRTGRHGLYLVDSFGNRELLYADASIGCFDPMPMRPRASPPAVPHVSGAGRPPGDPAPGPRAGPAEGTVAVINVYDGLKPWPQGTKIKALRIIQLFPKKHGTWMGYPEIGVAPESLARGVLGTVPVEADGSAHFTAPAGKTIYFQALDERGLAVQSMQSATYVQPGARLTCQGCHERRYRAPAPPAGPRLALRRGPSRIISDVDGSYPLLYPRLVQPVLDRRCVPCHRKHPKAPDLTGRPVLVRPEGRGSQWAGPATIWSKSFQSVRHYAFGFSGKPPGRTPVRTTPGQFGALASRLYQMLAKGHHDLKPPADELYRITLWLDCNSNFFGAYRETERQAQGEVVLPEVE